jgi:hypothetical protein
MSPCGKIIPIFDFLNRTRFILVAVFVFLLTQSAQAQVNNSDTSRKGMRWQRTAQPGATDSTATDAATRIVIDSLTGDTTRIAVDSIAKDTVVSDSMKRVGLEEELGIRLSPDALDDIVTSEAVDSAIMDLSTNKFFLYGKAVVNFQDMKLEAGQLMYDQDSNRVTAAPPIDSIGIAKIRPSFKQGQETFTYDSMQYNFKSKRAIVRNVRSQYGEGYIWSQQVKRNPDQSIYGSKSIYTTCALDTPHFGIVARRIKVVPGRVVASGPANIAIEEIPTPIFLPFGLFPIQQGQRSGFKLPMYTIEERRGLGITNGGYYFNINEYVDFLLQSNIYSKGSYSVSGLSTYTNRYRYSGGVNFAYSYDKNGETYEQNSSIAKDFQFNWEHRSDVKSRPGVSFNSSVHFGTASFLANNTYTVSQILNNQYNSNITYSKNWQNKPYSFTMSARHSQNTNTGEVEVRLPDVTFFLSQFNPFQGKNGTGNRWYEKITSQYTVNAVNQIKFYDSSFSLNTLALSDFQNGMVHTIPVSASYNVLRFVNLSFNTTYKEYWLTKQFYQAYNTNQNKLDSFNYNGFYTARDYSASISANTRIYGLKMFKKGRLMGIRHVLTPNVSLNYTPDFAAVPYRYGYKTITEANGQPQYRSAFEGSVVGIPGNSQFGNFSSVVGFGVDNNLQIKMRSYNDSTGFKNIRLIDNFRINTGYDLARDSFNWSDINVSFATNIMEMINITAQALFDPYDLDRTTGRSLPTTRWDAGKGIARFRSGSITAQASFRSIKKEKKAPLAGEETTDEFKRLMQYGRYDDYVDFNVPWNLNVQYSLQVTNQYVVLSQRDSLQLNNFASFGGDVNLTPNWKIALQLTSIDIYRDLHCFEMRLGAIPFGRNKNYNFTLNVKASILQDLKLLRRRDFRDSIQ